MDLFIYIVLGTAFLVVMFLITAALLPSKVRIERDLTMAAPPEDIFTQVNNFHNWRDWSPWVRMDPAAKVEFDGPESGEGSIFRWNGNEKVGKGNLTITESDPVNHLSIRTEASKPVHAVESMEFLLEPDGGATHVIWRMTGRIGFTDKIIGMFMDYDKRIGNEFVKGLASIKEIVERENTA